MKPDCEEAGDIALLLVPPEGHSLHLNGCTLWNATARQTTPVLQDLPMNFEAAFECVAILRRSKMKQKLLVSA